MRKTYIVTERAGDWVAGQRKPASGRMVLTDSQAAHELRLGAIIPAEPEKPQEPAQKRKRGKAARQPRTTANGE